METGHNLLNQLEEEAPRIIEKAVYDGLYKIHEEFKQRFIQLHHALDLASQGKVEKEK